MGEKVITVEFSLAGFAGPSALKSFDNQAFLEDVVGSVGDRYVINGFEVLGERFEGQNTERYRVEPYSLNEWAIRDTQSPDGYEGSKLVYGEDYDEARCQAVAALLNEWEVDH